MKICVITATYPLESFGGVFVKEQCEQLVANGHEVSVLYCAGKQSSIKDSKVHHFEENGVKVWFCCYPYFATTYAPRFWCGKMLIQLQKLYDALEREFGKPDVFYAHFSFPTGVIAAKLGMEKKIPVVIAEHWSGLINGKAKGRVLAMMRKAMGNASAVICVSPVLRDAVVKMGVSSEKITVIPNMISPDFSYHPRENKEKFVFFSLGTINPKKQFDILVEAFIQAFSEDESVELRIGGKGPDEKKITRMIASNKRNEQIKMLGQLDRKETLLEYKHCDSFILLSPKETFGIVYREAMATGRPVISLENGGIRYNWSSDYGIIINPSASDTVDVAARTMREMVRNYCEYDGRLISDETLNVFSGSSVSKKIEDVLKHVVDMTDEPL